MESKHGEEEDHTYQVCVLDRKSEDIASPPPRRGLGLDLTRAMSAEKKEESLDRNHNIQESEIMVSNAALGLMNTVSFMKLLLKVVFDLPDGSMGESTFKLGQTVEFLKSFVESEYGIPMAAQVICKCYQILIVIFLCPYKLLRICF